MSSFQLSAATMSLGRPLAVHNLPKKLEIAADHGCKAIELYWDDFHQFAVAMLQASAPTDEDVKSQQEPPAPTKGDYLRAAALVRAECARYDLTIVSLQPFRNFEGTLDAEARQARIVEWCMWLDIAAALGTSTIGVPSTIVAAGHTGDRDTLIRDLKEIAALAAARSPPVKIAYENLCFGAYIQTWEQAYDLVEAVDMPNFGFLPDTFNICGAAWADPAAEDGKTRNADANLRRSLDAFRRRVKADKIFLLQVADGERLAEPLLEGHPYHNPEQTPRMSWSRSFRCFPAEQTGYLPFLDVIRAVVDVGYTGWVSMEIFSHTTAAEDELCVLRQARRARAGWKAVTRAMGWAEASVVTVEEEDDDDVTDISDDVTALTSRFSEADTEVETFSGEYIARIGYDGITKIDLACQEDPVYIY